MKGRVLITGAGGMLGSALDRLLVDTEHLALTRAALDVTDASAVRSAVRYFRPQLVFHCAAYTRVDDAERDRDLAFAVNATGAANMASACAEVGARMVYPSTDYVFDGTARVPYTPHAPVAPLNAYGSSKLEGERQVLAGCEALVVRTSWLYGAGGRNFVRTITDRLRAGKQLRVVADQEGAPTWTPDLARSLLALAPAAPRGGIFHLTNSGSVTWFGFACEIATQSGLDADIQPCTTADYPTPARRPSYSVLNCSDAQQLIPPVRSWSAALKEALTTGCY